MSTLNRRFARFSTLVSGAGLADFYMLSQSHNVVLATSDDFSGLPKGVHPYNLVYLVRDVSSLLGLNATDIEHLRYLVSLTKEVDWESGARPVVYKSVQKMARHYGITERQLNRIENKLKDVGCLTYHSVGNNRRMGCRDKNGRIVFAYGVDLSPLADLHDRLIELKRSMIEDMLAFEKARLKFSSIKKQIRWRLAAAAEISLIVDEQAQALAQLPQRVSARMSIGELTGCVKQAQSIRDELARALKMNAPEDPSEAEENNDNLHKMSDRTDKNVRHIQTTNSPSSAKADTCSLKGGDNDRKEVVKSVTSVGVEIDLQLAISVASQDFLNCILPTGQRPTLSDVTDGAGRLCHHHGIHKSAWAEACSVMGRNAATGAIIIIDQGIKNSDMPIRSPGGYLRGMTRKALAGELNLNASLFGLQDRIREGGGKFS